MLEIKSEDKKISIRENLSNMSKKDIYSEILNIINVLVNHYTYHIYASLEGDKVEKSELNKDDYKFEVEDIADIPVERYIDLLK